MAFGMSADSSHRDSICLWGKWRTYMPQHTRAPSMATGAPPSASAAESASAPVLSTSPSAPNSPAAWKRWGSRDRGRRRGRAQGGADRRRPAPPLLAVFSLVPFCPNPSAPPNQPAQMSSKGLAAHDDRPRCWSPKVSARPAVNARQNTGWVLGLFWQRNEFRSSQNVPQDPPAPL